MGLLEEEYEGQIIIGWSGHKSESTVKQYIRKLPPKKKREISQYLGNNIKPKVAKKDASSFSFKPVAATVSVPPVKNHAEVNPPEEANADQGIIHLSMTSKC